ncbi:MAG: hypothetical protein ABIL22_04575, partial [candidate division WOR-3 bacterium]
MFAIFVCTTIAWIILGSVITTRTQTQDSKLRGAVGMLWGTAQSQCAPDVYYITTQEKKVTTYSGEEKIVETRIDTTRHPINVSGSNINVSISLEHRKKGLLWYPTYKVNFNAKYTITNNMDKERNLYFDYWFPSAEGVYDNFYFMVDGIKTDELKPVSGKLSNILSFKPQQTRTIEINYNSQGMDEWWYLFGSSVSHIQNFNLTINTDFNRIDFPENSISPTNKEKTKDGWKLTWQYTDLISGIQIGLKMPQKVNPGPFV